MTEPAGQQTSPPAVLCALAAAAAFVCVIAPSAIGHTLSGFSIGVVFGLLAGCTALPVVWAALGPGRLAIRVSLAFLLMVVFFCNFTIGLIIAQGGPGSFKDFLQQLARLPLFFLLAQSPFAMMRMVTGWRIERRFSRVDEQRHRGRQFGIGELLTVMTFIAFALATARWSFSQESSRVSWPDMLMQLGLPLGIMLVWISAVGPPCVLAVFRARTLGLSAAITALHAGLLVLMIVAIMVILSRGTVEGDSVLFVGCLHGATFAVLWSGLATMRRLGYRLGPRPMRSDRFHGEKEAFNEETQQS